VRISKFVCIRELTRNVSFSRLLAARKVKRRSEIGHVSEPHLGLAGKLRTKGMFEALLKARQTESLVLKKKRNSPRRASFTRLSKTESTSKKLL